ncbi:MAG: ABC transporter permease [Lachnospiraceae bacterium]|nr:ABC transporter permease [Lachnospiraceae bacterium]
MRKVKNNKAIKRLAVKGFRASRTRNIIAVAAIILTAVLFTAVFTIGFGLIEHAEQTSMQQAGGDAHGAIKELSQEQYDILKKHPLIKECGRDIVTAHSINNKEFLKRHLEMHYIDKEFYPHWFINIIEGRAPETADEILLDKKSLQLLGVEPEPGCQVTLEIQVHMQSKPVKRTFTVSGITEPSVMNVGFAIVPEAYIEKYAEEITADSKDSYSSTGKISMHVIFANSMNIQEKLNQVITESGFSIDMESANYIESNANWAYISGGTESDPVTIIGIIAALLLIMAAGYLIIYNIFQISIINDIRYYGLLKTIGTTGRQIKKILRRQALWLCIAGIPAGLLAGFFAGRFLLPLLLLSESTNKETTIHVSPNLWIFIFAAVFTIITVLISEWKPGRIAAKVSPVEALRYTEYGKKDKKQKKTTDGGKITRMAFSNLGRSKGRTVIVICSLSLTIVLMNSVYTITNSINRETFLSKMILSECIIGNAVLWNNNYFPSDEKTAKEESLSESFISACTSQEGFKDGGRIYMSTSDVKMPVESWKIPDNIQTDKDGAPGAYEPVVKEFTPFSGYETGAYNVELHGIERFVLSKMAVVEGEKDKDVIWDKLGTGRYIIYAVDVDDDNSILKNKVKHHAGDKITLNYNDKTTKEYEIISVVKRHSFSLTNRISSNFSYYVSADEFKENLSEQLLMSFLFDTKEGQEDNMEKFLENYTSEEEPLMSYESRKTYEESFNEIIGMITVTGTGLSGIIGLIGILNFINVIVTSITTRKREFAMMEAIGMTKRQLKGMLRAEGIFYSVLSILFSFVAGTIFSLTAIKTIGGSIWFINYKFTLVPVLVTCPVLLVFGAIMPGIVFALRKKESITEQIRG